MHLHASLSNTSRKQVLQVRAVRLPFISFPQLQGRGDTRTSHSKRVEAASRSVLKTRRRTLPAHRQIVIGCMCIYRRRSSNGLAGRGPSIQVQAVFGCQGLLMNSTCRGATHSFICLSPAPFLPAPKRTLCKGCVPTPSEPLAPSFIHTHCPAPGLVSPRNSHLIHSRSSDPNTRPPRP